MLTKAGTESQKQPGDGAVWAHTDGEGCKSAMNMENAGGRDRRLPPPPKDRDKVNMEKQVIIVVGEQ